MHGQVSTADASRKSSPLSTDSCSVCRVRRNSWTYRDAYSSSGYACDTLSATVALQVLGTYRMDYDDADIIESAAIGNGHYEYLQVCPIEVAAQAFASHVLAASCT